MHLFFITLIGCILGRVTAGWSSVMLRDMNSGGLISCPQCAAPVTRRRRWLSLLPLKCACGVPSVTWHLISTIGLGGLFLLFSWLMLNHQCESVHEVRPDTAAIYLRLPFHLSLIFLLWVATVTDLLDYVIPDEVIFLGVLIALSVATATGEAQMIHIWVNWDEAFTGLQGPYLPQWIKDDQHLHGLAWSLSGMTCGFILTWMIRLLSQRILGQAALGFGDAMLMAMVGAYLGWQPTLCVLAIAPLMGVVVGFVVRLLTGRSFVAYGPYLAGSAVLVMCTWRWLWADYLSLRDIFSHWPSVAGLVVLSVAALVVLLILLRVFRTLPAESLRR